MKTIKPTEKTQPKFQIEILPEFDQDYQKITIDKDLLKYKSLQFLLNFQDISKKQNQF